MTEDEKNGTDQDVWDPKLCTMEATEIARRLGFLQFERAKLEALIMTCQGAMKSVDDRIGLHLTRLSEIKDILPKKDLKDIPSTPSARMKASEENAVMPCPMCPPPLEGMEPTNLDNLGEGRRTCPECSTSFADGDAVREAWARREVAEMAVREDNNGEDEMGGEPLENGPSVKCPGVAIGDGTYSGCSGGSDCPVCEGRPFVPAESEPAEEKKGEDGDE